MRLAAYILGILGSFAGIFGSAIVLSMAQLFRPGSQQESSITAAGWAGSGAIRGHSAALGEAVK